MTDQTPEEIAIRCLYPLRPAPEALPLIAAAIRDERAEIKRLRRVVDIVKECVPCECYEGDELVCTDCVRKVLDAIAAADKKGMG